MSLEALRKDIRKQADDARKERLAAAKEEAGRITGKAEEEAKTFLQKEKSLALAEAKGLQSILSAARLEAKKKVAEARDALVGKELEESRKELLRFPSSSKYPPLLKKWVEAASKELGKGAVAYVRKKDVPLLKKWGYTAMTIECSGGCVVSTPDNRIHINNTLEALFESKQDFLRQKIFEEL
ncbi:hypothetical protein HZC09_00905 [Candidatus Micrarchaeota archaeon]|nr:hypothetical protein [Candidatus Micrarchaeota archaeon]